MSKYIFLLVFLVICPLNTACFAVDITAAKITLSSENETIRSLTQKVFEQTGYTLLFPENFYSMEISGDFRDVALQDLLSSVLKGISYSLEINEEDAWAIVHVFSNSSSTDIAGKKGPRSASAQYAELVKIAEENEKRYQAFKNNPDSIDPRSGLSFKDVIKRVDSAEAKIKEFLDNEDSIDPFSGEKISNIKHIAAKNSEKVEEFLASPDSKDPLSGKNIQELRKTALKQQQEFDQHPIKMQ